MAKQEQQQQNFLQIIIHHLSDAFVSYLKVNVKSVLKRSKLNCIFFVYTFQ